MNYYEILGVAPDASPEEIERAYRALARKVHPDLNGGDPARAELRMKQLNEIRETLGDSLLRSAYDTELRREREAQEEARRQAEASPAGDYVRVGQSPFTASTPVPPPSRLPRVAILLSAALAIATGGVVFGRAHHDIEPSAPEGELGDDPVGQEESPPAPAAAELPPPRHRLMPAMVAPPSAPSGESASERPDDRGAGSPATARPRRLRPAIPGAGGVVRIGSTAAEVIRKFGPPQHTEPGSRPGNVVFVYGQLRLELRSGLVVSGSAM